MMMYDGEEKGVAARYLLMDLPPDTDENDLHVHFGACGELEEVSLKRHPETGEIRASVKFANPTLELRALMLNRTHEIRGQTVKVQTWKMQKLARPGYKAKGRGSFSPAEKGLPIGWAGMPNPLAAGKAGKGLIAARYGPWDFPEDDYDWGWPTYGPGPAFGPSSRQVFASSGWGPSPRHTSDPGDWGPYGGKSAGKGWDQWSNGPGNLGAGKAAGKTGGGGWSGPIPAWPRQEPSQTCCKGKACGGKGGCPYWEGPEMGKGAQEFYGKGGCPAYWDGPEKGKAFGGKGGYPAYWEVPEKCGKAAPTTACGGKGGTTPHWDKDKDITARYLLTGMDPETTEEDLRNYFGIFGAIEEVTLRLRSDAGEMTGSVKFDTPTMELRRLMLNESHEIRGVIITVQTWKMRKLQRPSMGGKGVNGGKGFQDPDNSMMLYGANGLA
mmetsp:Transcript_107680/g.332660  ORF Transcript_107680/g.332660 Transcript_107680/m.332660 type:complete len:439 (-) Transcript_107680:132-1448(-)